MKLPERDYLFYCGIDPGFSGAVAVMNQAGTTVKLWPMPLRHRGEKDRQREIDLDGLREIFRHLRRLPDVCVGLEWPTTRPGEGAERCERFGRGKGYLEAFCYLHNLEYFMLAPALWTGRLGLQGKTVQGAVARRAGLFQTLYPQWAGLIRGPRGGVLDGPLDALLISHFLRKQSTGGIKAIVDTFGRGSLEAYVAVFGGGKKRRKRLAS